MRIVPEEFHGGDGVTLHKYWAYFTFHECKREGFNSKKGHIEGSFVRKGKYKTKPGVLPVVKWNRKKGERKKEHRLFVRYVSELYPEWYRELYY